MDYNEQQWRALYRATACGAIAACIALLAGGLTSLVFRQPHRPSAAVRHPASSRARATTTVTAAAARVTSTTTGRPPSTTAPTSPRTGVAAADTSWATPLDETHLAAPVVAATVAGHGSELVLVGADGGVFPVGAPGFFGSMAQSKLRSNVVAVAANPVTGGYWLAAADGGVFSFHAPFLGTTSGAHLGAATVAMAPTPSGRGYWLAGADGGVFAYGDARFSGSLAGRHLASRVVAISATPSGRGYILVAADGGVFAFGDAHFAGGLAGTHLSAPVVAAAVTPTGRGYWLASADGGVFAFGDARWLGGASKLATGSPIQALVPTPSGSGYWLVGGAGNVFAFGDANHVADGADLNTAAVVSAATTRPVVSSRVTRYRSRSVGFDISTYQCGDIPPAPAAVAVVQVTGGALDNDPNPCYVKEAQWAGPAMSAYLYVDGLPSPAPAAAVQGVNGPCPIGSTPCEGWNYGYAWARHWVTWSDRSGVRPKMWWLDVERYSGWTDPATNDAVIEGAIAGVKAGGGSVGIYSSAGQWSEIAGGLSLPGTPLWVPGAGDPTGPGHTAASFCADPTQAFAGGHVALVQYGYSGPFAGSYSGPATDYDLDYAC